MLANVTIAVAGLGFVLVLLEIFVGDTQKQWLNDKTHDLWFWLAEARKRALLDWLRIRYRWVLGAAILLASCYIVWNVSLYEGAGNATAIIIGALIFGVGLWFGPKIVRVTLNATTLFRAGLWATLFVVVAFLPIALLGAITPYFSTTFLPTLLTPQATLGIALGQLATVLVIITSINFTAISAIFWITVATPLFIVYVLTALLFIFEYALRRIAEYPKGPLFAATAIVAALGLLLKALH